MAFFIAAAGGTRRRSGALVSHVKQGAGLFCGPGVDRSRRQKGNL